MIEILKNNNFNGTSFLYTLKCLFESDADIHLVYSAWNMYFDTHFNNYKEAVQKIRVVDRSYAAMSKTEVVLAIVDKQKA